MNKRIIILGLIFCTLCSGICLSSDDNIVEEQTNTNASGVICSRNKKRCMVGQHLIKTNGRRPLYIRDGIVCTPDRRNCTNGFSWMRSNKPIE